jgi:hypothetical protein
VLAGAGCPNTGWAWADRPVSGSSCIVRQKSLWTTCCKRDGQQGMQVRACAGVALLCVLPFPQSPPQAFHPCASQDPAAHQHPRRAQSTQPLDRRCRELEQTHPKLLAAGWTRNQKTILAGRAIPTLYPTHVKMSGVPMPARMYLFVPACQGVPHHPGRPHRPVRRC